ncbi:hypothetical protein ABK040_003743 [Willaertia magna]
MGLEDMLNVECREADEFMKKGDNVLIKKIHLGNRKKDAQRYYEKAGEAYQSCRMFAKSGEAFYKSAQILEEQGEQLKAASHYNLSCEQYLEEALFEKGENYNKAMEILGKASLLYAENGQTMQAARKEKELGDRLSDDSIEEPDILRLAIESYRKAIDYFTFMKSFATANSCLERIGFIYVKIKAYKEASKVYEEILYSEWNDKDSTLGENSLIRFQETKYIFYHMITRLACLKEFYTEEDLDLIQIDLDTLCNTRKFENTRQYGLVQAAIEAFREKNLKIYLKAVKLTLETTKMEEWEKKILLDIRRRLEDEISGASLLEDENGEIDLC